MLKVRAEESKVGEELIQHIVESRFRQKKNTFIAICGGVGEGKSYCALKLAELIQPDFDPKEQVCFYPDQFLKIIEQAKQREFKVVLLDEAHVTVNARLWYSFANLAVSLVASTFRQLKNLVVIIVAPNINWVEKSIREMINYYAVVFRKEGSPAYLKLYQVGFNYFDIRDQNPYLKRVVFAWNGKTYKLNVLKVGLPSERVIQAYEETAIEFKKRLVERQLEETIRKIEKTAKASVKNLEDIASALLENQKLLENLVRNTKKGFKLKSIVVKSLFKLTDSEVKELENILINKMKQLGWLSVGEENAS